MSLQSNFKDLLDSVKIALDKKQDKLTGGAGISVSGNTISLTGDLLPPAGSDNYIIYSKNGKWVVGPITDIIT